MSVMIAAALQLQLVRGRRRATVRESARRPDRRGGGNAAMKTLRRRISARPLTSSPAHAPARSPAEPLAARAAGTRGASAGGPIRENRSACPDRRLESERSDAVAHWLQRSARWLTSAPLWASQVQKYFVQRDQSTAAASSRSSDGIEGSHQTAAKRPGTYHVTMLPKRSRFAWRSRGSDLVRESLVDAARHDDGRDVRHRRHEDAVVPTRWRQRRVGAVTFQCRSGQTSNLTSRRARRSEGRHR